MHLLINKRERNGKKQKPEIVQQKLFLLQLFRTLQELLFNHIADLK